MTVSILSIHEGYDSVDEIPGLDEEFVDHGIKARILHSTRNGERETNRHAIKMGETTIVIEISDEESQNQAGYSRNPPCQGG